jgi:hypothetical protein
MKTYSDNEVLKWNWLKRQSYIPSSDAIGDGSNANLILVEKFSIDNIIHDEKNYKNPISMKDVLQMIDEFYPFGFYPIRLNQYNILQDGQHRLKFALICGLKYIDVWIENTK